MQDTIEKQAILEATSVRSIEHQAVINSTNRRAMERLKDGTDLPLLIVADQQTAGRGRGANAWWSPHGCLMFSLVLARTETNARLPPYSLAVGLAVRSTVAAALPEHDVKVKWPNDVYVSERKICGVLIELPPGGTDKLVIGVGINVNNSVSDAPADVASSVAAICDLAEHPTTRTQVLTSVLNAIESEIDSVATDFVERWQPHCYLSGRTVRINRGSQCDRGICQGINSSGALLLESGAGVTAVSSGTVHIESG